MKSIILTITFSLFFGLFAYPLSVLRDDESQGEYTDPVLMSATTSYKTVKITNLDGTIIKESSITDDYLLETLPIGEYILSFIDQSGNIVETVEYTK